MRFRLHDFHAPHDSAGDAVGDSRLLSSDGLFGDALRVSRCGSKAVPHRRHKPHRQPTTKPTNERCHHSLARRQAQSHQTQTAATSRTSDHQPNHPPSSSSSSPLLLIRIYSTTHLMASPSQWQLYGEFSGPCSNSNKTEIVDALRVNEIH